MTGPATPGQEGPSFAPPPLPEGWIAQWDGMSRKYYFVQLSTGVTQWDTPTHAAPTGPTPNATPQGVEHPYGTPAHGQGQGQEVEGEFLDNGDGTRSVRFSDGRVEQVPRDGERGLGSFAMQQLLGGKKQNQSGLGQLGGLASQYFSGGSSHNNQSSGSSSTSGIVGALASQFLGGGKKPEATSYTGSQNSQHQSQGGGLMNSLGGMFGGHSSAPQGNNYGYSQNNSQYGGYTGSAPPTAYQPSGSGHAAYNPPATPQAYANQSKPPSQSYSSEHAYSQSPHQQQPPYGVPSNQPPYGGGAPPQSSYDSHTPSSQPPYGGGPPPHSSYAQTPSSQAPYGSGQPPYGGIQHQPSYGSGHPTQPQQYSAPPNYDHGGGGYGAPPNSGHYAEMSGGSGGYGGGGQGPNVPMGSHPHHGHQQPPGPPGGYPGAGYQGQQGRW